jgi:hypothetical protein
MHFARNAEMELENLDDKLSGNALEAMTKKMTFTMQKAMTITDTRNGIDFATLHKLLDE